MAYTKTTWVNDTTELSAENMNHIENGIADSYNISLLAVTNTAPAECSTGDKYFNTTTKKIYTATGTNTWGSTGEDPISDILYVVFDERTTYSYNGDTLISVGGGGGGGIAVYPDEPEEDTKLYIEETDLDGQYLPIEEDVYSTNEVKTNKVWIDGKSIYRVCKNVGALPNNGRIQPTFEGIIPANVMVTSLSGIAQKNNGDSYDCRPIETMTTLLMYRPHLYSLYIDTNQDFSTWEGIITIEYTKATD